jgi:hypothetical protein
MAGKADSRKRVAHELRHAALGNGGTGCAVLVSGVTGQSLWLTDGALEALERAAERLGFLTPSGPWMAVVSAICDGCLPDLLSEAIEELESECTIMTETTT